MWFIVKLLTALLVQEQLPEILLSPTALTHQQCDVRLHNERLHLNLNMSSRSWQQSRVNNGRET